VIKPEVLLCQVGGKQAATNSDSFFEMRYCFGEVPLLQGN
jgi:hypothetical protein